MDVVAYFKARSALAKWKMRGRLPLLSIYATEFPFRFSSFSLALIHLEWMMMMHVIFSFGLIGLKGLLIWINVIHLTALMFLFQLLFWVSAQLLEDTDVGGLFPVRALHLIFTALAVPVCPLSNRK